MGLTYAFAGVGLAWHTASPAHPWMGEGTPGAAELDLGLAGPREGLQGQGGCVPKRGAPLRCSGRRQKSRHHPLRWWNTVPGRLRAYRADVDSDGED